MKTKKSLLINITANYLGRFWSIVSNYVFVPLYISLLGVDGFSIISFSIVLTSLLAIVDSGMTSTLSREFALTSRSHDQKRKLFLTLETAYLVLVGATILILVLLSDVIADKWLILEQSKNNEVGFYLKVIAISIFFQMLGSFYLGGLLGFELQVKANLIQVVWGVLRNGVVVILIYFSPDLYTFFTWQAAVNLVYCIVLRHALLKELQVSWKNGIKPKVDWRELKRVKSFAGGMFLVTIISAINTQIDKLFISKLLDIEWLGIYNLATMLSQFLVIIVIPVTIALLPRFTLLLSNSSEIQSGKLFLNTVQSISILVFSLGGFVIFFPKELIYLWTGNLELSNSAGEIVPFLAGGMFLLAIQAIPFNISVATGCVKFINKVGLLSFLFTIPGYWFAVNYWGAVGATYIWFVLQLVLTVLFMGEVMNRVFSRINPRQLITKSSLPLVLSFVLTYGYRHFVEIEMDKIQIFLLVAVGLSVLFLLNFFLFMPMEYQARMKSLIRKNILMIL